MERLNVILLRRPAGAAEPDRLSRLCAVFSFIFSLSEGTVGRNIRVDQISHGSGDSVRRGIMKSRKGIHSFIHL